MKKILSLFLISIVFVACNNSKAKRSKPSSTGGSGEMLIVVETSFWDTKVGSELVATFEQEFQRLPQPEPYFDIVNITNDNFGKVLQSHRNIFIVDIALKHSETKIDIKQDLWAQPQIVITVSCNNQDEFLKAFSENKERFLSLYIGNEHKRIINAFEKSKNQEIISMLNKKFGINMIIPTGFYLAKETEDFCWIRQETADVSLGLMVHAQEYRDTSQFGQDAILTLRNYLTKQHIPGPIDSSYMTTEMHQGFEPISTKVNVRGNYAVETIGLWKTIKSFMAGPFIRYSILDQKNNTIITVEGFVYAPKFEKRNYYRQVEAILHSLEFVSAEKEKEKYE